MAMLIQYLSAKAGIATGKSLAGAVPRRLPARVTRGLWVQAEIVAIATDLAEVLGGAHGAAAAVRAARCSSAA